MIIAISGKKRVGKDTVARMLCQQLAALASNSEYLMNSLFYNLDKEHIKDAYFTNLENIDKIFIEKISFAYGLKRLLCELLDIPSISELDSLKTSKNGLKLSSKEGHIYTIRELLQLIGTEALRDVIDPTIWIKKLNSKVDFKGNTVTIISDLRMPNELEFLIQKAKEVQQPLLILALEGKDNLSSDSHISEQGIDFSKFPEIQDSLHIIENTSSLQDLWEKVQTITDKYILPNLKINT